MHREEDTPELSEERSAGEHKILVSMKLREGRVVHSGGSCRGIRGGRTEQRLWDLTSAGWEGEVPVKMSLGSQ